MVMVIPSERHSGNSVWHSARAFFFGLFCLFGESACACACARAKCKRKVESGKRALIRDWFAKLLAQVNEVVSCEMEKKRGEEDKGQGEARGVASFEWT